MVGPREGIQPASRRADGLEAGVLQRLAHCLDEQWQEIDDVAPRAIEGLACEMAAQFCRTVRVKLEPNPPPG